jgi:hypothetical protein
VKSRNTGLSYKTVFATGLPRKTHKKEVFSLVRVSRTIAKTIEISSFSFYKKALSRNSQILF